MDPKTQQRERFVRIVAVFAGLSVVSLTVRAMVGVAFDVHFHLGADAIGRETVEGLRLDGLAVTGHIPASDVVGNLLHAAPGVFQWLAVAITALLLRRGLGAPYDPDRLAWEADRDEWFGRAVVFATMAGLGVAVIGSYCHGELVSRVYDDGYGNFSVTLEPFVPAIAVWLLTKWWALPSAEEVVGGEAAPVPAQHRPPASEA